ncbi:DUF4442 domain-containing protein [Catenovulum sediminis]|uniref:DUF4442 domain-containing protein n=1 Tax=Catenovulum sediminis TaxID=1740262 RepID=A0ABV1RM15_9ALTE
MFKYPRLIKMGLNLWPPFLFSGIKISELANDYRYLKVELKHSRLTLNANRTQFGGSIYSMTDPVYSLLLMANLGHKYHVWDKSAEIDYVYPGHTKLIATAHLSQSVLDDILLNTQHGEKYFPKFQFNVVDLEGRLVAKVNRTLYVRLKAAYRKNNNV